MVTKTCCGKLAVLRFDQKNTCVWAAVQVLARNHKVTKCKSFAVCESVDPRELALAKLRV